MSHLETINNYISVNNLQPFPVEKRGLYHTIVSLIISQRIRFKVAQRIRSKIYTLHFRLGEIPSLDNIMMLTEQQRSDVGLSNDKWQIITQFDHKFINFISNEDLASIKGIGPWTIQCARIMSGDYSTGFINTDLYVNNLIKKICDCNLTKQQIADIFRDIDINQAGRIFSILWNSVRKR